MHIANTGRPRHIIFASANSTATTILPTMRAQVITPILLNSISAISCSCCARVVVAFSSSLSGAAILVLALGGVRTCSYSSATDAVELGVSGRFDEEVLLGGVCTCLYSSVAEAVDLGV